MGDYTPMLTDLAIGLVVGLGVLALIFFAVAPRIFRFKRISENADSACPMLNGGEWHCSSHEAMVGALAHIKDDIKEIKAGQYRLEDKLDRWIERKCERT